MDLAHPLDGLKVYKSKKPLRSRFQLQAAAFWRLGLKHMKIGI
jgi:hypothetical protein